TERRDVAVGVDVHGGARQAAAVDDAGVVERVAEDLVTAADEGADRADVGLVARGKEQRRLGTLEGGELALDLDVEIEVAGDQPRRPRSASPAAGGLASRPPHRTAVRP